jgi:hypothetical protein
MWQRLDLAGFQQEGLATESQRRREQIGSNPGPIASA